MHLLPSISLLPFSLLLTLPPTLAQYTNQSAPFGLVLLSPDPTINSSFLASCHTGAAIESLCLASATGIPSTTYNFNTSEFSGSTGILTYVLRGSNFNESEPLTLYYNPASNVALPLLEPSDSGVPVGFDDQDLLYVSSYVDDRVSPPTVRDQKYYRWYACRTYFLGYQYQTLAFGLGDTQPQNPTCIKTDVKRLFV
ncbi:MAG: hypothetical protein Q9160_002932 [Pyrenula sp. 1 TL-2023]